MMRSDLLFNLGYALLWVGLFAVARKGLSRLIIVVLFHLVTGLIALFTACAYRYFIVTGSTLDSDFILLWFSSPEGTGGAIASEVTRGLLLLILAVLIYAVLGPPMVARFVAWWRGWSGAGTRTARAPWLRLAGVGLVTYALFSFSLLPGGESAGASKSFSRDPVVNVVMTAADVTEGETVPEEVAADVPTEPPPEARLRPTSEAERRNVVLIFLESTRAGATTPYNQPLKTTPFMDELARSSLLAQRAYTVVPHTHNAITATNCGIEPPLDRQGTLSLGARDNSVPSTCLADLLKKEGYNTVYFMSQTATFEESPKILENLGYQEFHSVESMETEGFEKASYFGYEDDIMLRPSEEWLRKNGDKPFLATYLTAAPHHDYQAPQQRYGRVEFSEDDLVNRYLNSVRNQDFFLKKLFDQYKRLGLYEDTVFIVLGDHGEAFGEHERYQHDNVPYEEGLRVPMLVHDPRWCGNDGCEEGWRIETPVNQLDILPTIPDLLGYQLGGGPYEGSSLLRPIPEGRTLMFSCWNESGCLASLEGTKKYIYHFGDQPEEIFDLSEDPLERQNLAGELPEEAERRRLDLLKWRMEVNSKYAAAAASE